ncbi:universal stress protein [Natronomonas sp. F2-12]|jgi:nucleotide-binding universal stress UspA family protein|uniref:Universal stress protein n=1 Tax=Natronomonas aquatica TaxID=2841590 RepID=A0A9R1D5P6_9EURY|nr:universal stress protein [Natronomonas aquatica]MCQ4332107.1 universal stress protein [Natronomonas aquatica]
MDRYLVVADDSDAARELGSHAVELAEAFGIELVFARFVDRDNYQTRLQEAASLGRNIESIEAAERHAEEIAEEFAAEVVGDRDVSYRSAGIVDAMPEVISEFAHEEECDQVFIAGKQRSPTGKAIFGDRAQHVILNFDGFVTVNKTD